MLDIDLKFPHSYKIEEVGDFPGTGRFDVPIIYFPRPKFRQEHDGLWLRVRAASGMSWIGVFAYGYDSPPAISRVVSLPAFDQICVVSRGAAYVVNTNQPDIWEQLSLLPVTNLCIVPEHELLVMSDFTRLVAYERNGIAWRSPRVCWDELRIVKVTSGTIEGTGYDPTSSSHTSLFAVDIRTGSSLLPSPVSIDGKPVW